MSKTKKSGPAVFIDWVIFLGAVIAAVCFALYYTAILPHGVVLWTGVTAFTTMYHLGMRILFGKLTPHFGIRYTHPWFRERRFERGLYRFLRVRKWKEKVLTYDPAAFTMKNNSLEDIAYTMSKAETDHWINELISLSTLLFPLIWGEAWIFVITAVAAMLFDAQFIVVQRYNRPVVLRVIERRRKKAMAA